ncbi:MAG: 16S rRNA (adenine(1518)-N(6)/adenine(1519)-N(6))-dimethyltransferase RsmA [Thermoplasmata archaeon]
MNKSPSPLRQNVIKLLAQYGISPDDELGQSFLCDDRLLEQEIEYANVKKNDIVLEIGPGIGNLTDLLAQKAKKVIAIEKDIQYKQILSTLQRKYDNIDIIYADALDIDFPVFNKIVSNLPYKIALPLIFKILKHEFDIAALICQERLAHRICAMPGQKGYCRLSVQINRVSKVDLLKKIHRKSFYPPPEVDSAIIRIIKTLPQFEVPSDIFFKEVLKFLFSMREKTLEETLFALVETGVLSSKIKKIKSAINQKLLKKTIFMSSPKDLGKVTWILWKEIGEEIVDYFYIYYKINNLYNKSGDDTD